MTHTDDDVLVAFLRGHALDAVPPSGLDPRVVLASSRRKRAFVRGARAAAALVVAGAVVVGGVTLADRWDRPTPPVDEVPGPTTPQPTDADPQPADDAAAVGLAEGIRAVNLPVATTLADGTAVLDLGLGDAWPSLGDRLALTTGPAQGANPEPDVDPVFDAAPPGAEVRVWTASAEGLRTRVATLSWLPADTPADYPDGVYPAPTKVVEESVAGHTLLLGAVPSWITDPTVTLHLSGEVRLADGSTGRALAVPTFAAPTPDGRLLYLVAFDPSAGVSDGEGYAVTITDGPGRALLAGCPGSDVDACVAAVADPVSALPEMCAELPAGIAGTGPSYEGWWSSTPATEDGGVRTDPADWPPIMREHPRTVLVDTRNGKVLESFDRIACSSIPDYAVPAGLALPPDAVVVLDADTGEILQTMSPPYFEPQW
ncbi:hypothetical protein [Actinotalea fermentans]|uniref:Uncharacterized protein n=1 Tax=Actinotalea fermentans TaxID=43671 RepID=A0A511YXC5_9CELL|nr:hypothetical protein [Actinotalea fermentans]GEN79853.1 hypothetical protein AFE02nite_15870 [Actinotalea fermentans]